MNEAEPNLFSHFKEIRSGYIPEGGISTVIICGKMRSEGDASACLDTHRKVVEDEVKREKSNHISGICMAQGNSILHLLEGPCNSILRILSNLVESEHFVEPVVQNGRIIYNVEDRPCRYFPEWYSCTIQERKSQVDDVTEETSIFVVHDLAMKLLDVGKGLQSEPSGELELSLNKYAELLPGKNLIISLSNSQLFFPIEEYVEVFADPMQLTLESESTWPMERLVEY